MADGPFATECLACGEEYGPRDEVAEDHDESCPAYDDLRRQGKTRENPD